MFFIYFSELEHNIDVYISNMISDKGHEFSYSIIGFLKFDNKIDVFKNLSRKYIYFIDQSPILIKKLDNILNDIIDDMRKIQEFRNNLAHSYWNTTEK
jgi:hypothetical protein